VTCFREDNVLLCRRSPDDQSCALFASGPRRASRKLAHDHPAKQVHVTHAEESPAITNRTLIFGLKNGNLSYPA
jgi:hypothetical protein